MACRSGSYGDCRVMKVAGAAIEPIEGLYAGGRMLPYDYHVGFANSDAITCGRFAAAHAASMEDA